MRHTEQTVSDVMCTELIVVTDCETLNHADADMRLSDIRHLPVIDDEQQLCGILSDRDIYKALARPGKSTVLVSDVMTRDVITLPPEAPLREITALMLDHKVGAAPVVNADGELVGIVTETDILRIAHSLLGGDVMAVPEH